ncbi:cysteine hydrolase [Undibacterium sp. CY7W]|uniref:Cysteine hydrolase n=1 Tax=Undibacterium rugosum TaxID=2762291 RepID=A0A923I5R3_9BURK|nr:cysteine hydrolase family protein [Undibacterium rugosum]MBC3934063.1 cysteine hydrolase [Undibacterium rugosum]
MTTLNQTASAPRRALIVIDVQNEYFSGQMRISYPDPKRSLQQIGRAMDAAHQAGIPVFVIQHSAPENAPIFARGSDNWALHEEVARRPSTVHIEKTKASSFTGTTLDAQLQALQIDTLSIVGYMTHNCNASTVFEAAHRGYQVEILSDASGSLPYSNAAGAASAEEIHRVFQVVFHSNFASSCSTDQWLAALAQQVPLSRSNVYASHQDALSKS